MNAEAASNSMLVSTAKLDTTTFPNIRTKARNERDYTDLKNSIKKQGVLQSVTVCPGPSDTYIVLAGFGRVQAATELGLQYVPATIVDAPDRLSRVTKSLVENLQRSDLHWVDTAAAVAELVETTGDQKTAGKDIGKTQPWVSSMLKVAGAAFFTEAKARHAAGVDVCSFDAALTCARAWDDSADADDVVNDFVRICEGREEEETQVGGDEDGEESDGEDSTPKGKKKKIKVTREQVLEQIRLARKEENGNEEHKLLIQTLQWVAGDRKAPPFKLPE